MLNCATEAKRVTNVVVVTVAGEQEDHQPGPAGQGGLQESLAA